MVIGYIVIVRANLPIAPYDMMGVDIIKTPQKVETAIPKFNVIR